MSNQIVIRASIGLRSMPQKVYLNIVDLDAFVHAGPKVALYAYDEHENTILVVKEHLFNLSIEL